jgi:hypothetical protein
MGGALLEEVRDDDDEDDDPTDDSELDSSKGGQCGKVFEF